MQIFVVGNGIFANTSSREISLIHENSNEKLLRKRQPTAIDATNVPIYVSLIDKIDINNIKYDSPSFEN